MKVIKFLFNRSNIIVFLLIIEILLIAVSAIMFNAFFGYFYGVIGIISGIIILYVLNRDQDPVVKLPWVFVIIITAPIGGLIYILYGSNRPSKKFRNLFDKIFEYSKKYALINREIIKKLEEENPHIVSQAKFIASASSSPLYENSTAKYFSSGESFFEEFLNQLEKAKKFIFMEYFIIDSGVMWDKIHDILKRKTTQGVEIRIIYDDIGSIYRLPYNFDKIISAEGINCIKFNKFMPLISSIHNNRDHRKLTIIDGLVAFTGGINIADEYINVKKRFGHWKDSALMVNGQAVKNMTLEFLQMFNLQTGKLEDYEKYISATDEVQIETDGFIQPFDDGPAPLFKDRVGKNVLINILNQSKDYVYLTTPYLITDYSFLSAIKLAAKRGVDVKIITPHIPDKKIIFMQTRANYKQLLDAGVQVYEYLPGFMHSKIIVSDDTTAVVSTINIDYRSFVHHFECGVWLYKTKCINDIKNDFLKCVNLSQACYKGNYHFGFFKTLLTDMISIFSPLM